MVPDKHPVALQDLDIGSAVVDMLQALLAVLTETHTFNTQSINQSDYTVQYVTEANCVHFWLYNCSPFFNPKTSPGAILIY